MYILRKFCFLAFLFINMLGYAQCDYTAYYYGIKEGLNSENIYKTIISPSGRLYLATQRGITMYDGYRFIANPKIHTNTLSVANLDNELVFFDTKGLGSADHINSNPVILVANINTDSNPNNDHFENLFVDRKKRIWGTDFENVKYYDPETKKVSSFLFYPDNKNLITDISILEATQNEIWVAAPNGLWVWNENKNKFDLYPDSEINNLSYQLAEKLTGDRVILSTLQGQIIQVNSENHRITKRSPLPENRVAIGIEETHNGLVFCTADKIYAESKSGYKEIFRTENQSIRHMNYDARTGILWLSTSKGLIKLLPHNPAVQTDLFTDSTIISIAQDDQKRIWAITSDNRVWCKKDGVWKEIYREDREKLYNIHYSEGEIFLSAGSGIFILNGANFEKLNLTDHIKEEEIIKTFITPQKELWIVFATKKTECYTWPGLKKIENAFANPASFWSDNKWQDILADTHGRIWLAGWMPKSYGICYYDPGKREFVDVSDKSINPDKGKFVGDYYTKIGLGNGETVLFSAFGGWNRTDKNGKIIQKVDVHQYEIADTHFRGITEDGEGNVFFATGEGLHIYRKDIDQVVRITQSDGLPANYLLNSFCVLRNGNIALGVEKGIVTIRVQDIFKNVLTNKLEISRIWVNGNPKKFKANFIELNKEERDLNIQFSDLSFQFPEKAVFRYRFSDENVWHTLGHKPELLLYHLQPGKYKIIFRAEDNLGNIQGKDLALNILLHPPFTKSNLFYGLLFLAVLFLILLINRYVWNKQKKEQAYQRKIKEAEMQTLRSQMNPHFLFNTLNSINSFIIQNKTEDASSYLTTFSKLMRSILENSKQELITLQKELQTLKLYLELESVRLEHSFDYLYEIDDQINPNEVLIPPLVIQPFSENAIWHGLRNKKGKGLLVIKVKQPYEETLHIILEDNGIGREASRKLKKEQTHHKSYGIEITSERLFMLNSKNSVEIIDLYDSEGKPSGTQVIIKIKLRHHD